MKNAADTTARGATYHGPATWSLEIETGELRSSPARALMLGYAPDQFTSDSASWDALLHAEDRGAVRTARARHLLSEGSGYRSEYRARREDGSWAWLLEIGCIERDQADKALRVSGVILDISTEREAQFRLQQRLERLRTVFDYTYQFMGLLSAEGVVLETNRTSLKSAGASLDDTIGKPFWETPFWHKQPAEEVTELRAGIERASRGEFVRFNHEVRREDGATRIIDFSLLPVLNEDNADEVVWIVAEGRDITDIVNANRALRTLENRLEVATSSANLGLWDLNRRTGQAWHNARWWTMLGYEPDEMPACMNAWERLVHPDDQARARQIITQRRSASEEFRVEYRMQHKDGAWRWILCSGRTVEADEHGTPQRVAGVHLDVTDRKETEIRLASAERLESVGKLAAGIAHEINTPVQFVNDSVYFVKDSVNELLQLTDQLRELAARQPTHAATVNALTSDLPYLRGHLPKALDRAVDGLKRVAEIVRSMREFAHPDRPEMTEVDLNRAIENSLVVAHSEYKHVADIETDFGPLPMVHCHGGEVNQVMLNLLVNAAHAIADVVQDSGRKGSIRVATRQLGESVVISVADTGGGIPENIRYRIFEPFFTTKEVGRGTGQGLAIAHNIIVKRHGGSIEVHSELGRGTEFQVRLPLDCRQHLPRPSQEQAA